MKIWSKKLCSLDCQYMRKRSFFLTPLSKETVSASTRWNFGGFLEIFWFGRSTTSPVARRRLKSHRMDQGMDLSDQSGKSVSAVTSDSCTKGTPLGTVYLILFEMHAGSVLFKPPPVQIAYIFFKKMSYGQNVWGPLYQRCARNTAKRPPKAVIGKKTGKQHVPPKKRYQIIVSTEM